MISIYLSKEKKELIRAKNCLTLVQTELTQFYAMYGESIKPGKKPQNAILGEDNVKKKNNECMYTSNGNVNATDTEWSKALLRELILKEGNESNVSTDPYCIIFGVGSNIADENTTKASKHDRFTVYFLFYMEKEDSQPLWYFDGSWRTTRPTTAEIDKNNVIKVGSKKNMKLQYYVISNKTPYYPAGNDNFMKWYNSLP